MIAKEPFKSKTVIVVGGAHRIGRALSLGFAGMGAHVVVLDPSADVVTEIASQNPSVIEPLALKYKRPSSCRLLGECWGSAPAHLLVFAHALMVEERPGPVAKSILLLTDALRPALRAESGAIVTLLPRAEAGLDPIRQSSQAAFERLIQSLPKHLHQDRIRCNGVVLPPDTEPDHVLPMVAFLGGPGAQGVNGVLLPYTNPD